MKYIYILVFLFTHDLTELKKYWEVEFLKGKKFTWIRLIKRVIGYRNQPHEFYFFWRIANQMNSKGSRKFKKIAHIINKHLVVKYSVDISVEANIDVGLQIAHFIGITINKNAIIGKNFRIFQFVTIGGNSSDVLIKIGDNVSVYTSSVILGGKIKIGDNVKIGAMSFINKDIPSDHTVYTKKDNILILNKNTD